MGNSKSKQGVNTDLVVEPVVRKDKCVICFEEGKEGLKCEFNHQLCKECVKPYVTSVISDIGRLKDQGYCIRCPAVENRVQCKSMPLDASTILLFSNAHTLDRYVSTLSSLCQSNNRAALSEFSEKSSVVPKLLDTLNLRCPNKQCGVVMDPSPDGCCAVRCASCATYACFLCFQICRDGSSCHQHVRDCAYSPTPDELFLSEEARIPAHKRIRVMALRAALAREFLPSAVCLMAAQSTSCPDSHSMKLAEELAQSSAVARCLTGMQTELRDVSLTPQGVLTLCTHPVGKQPPQLATLEEQARRRREALQGQANPRDIAVPAQAARVFGGYNPNLNHTRRAAAFSILTFFVVFAALLYCINLLASISNRHLTGGNDKSGQEESRAFFDNFPVLVPCTAPSVGGVGSDDSSGTDSSGMDAYDSCNLTALSLARAAALSESLPCLPGDPSPQCSAAFEEPSLMVFCGESLVQLTVLLGALGMAVLFGLLVLDVARR